jgi:hypothetical protein
MIQSLSPTRALASMSGVGNGFQKLQLGVRLFHSDPRRTICTPPVTMIGQNMQRLSKTSRSGFISSMGPCFSPTLRLFCVFSPSQCVILPIPPNTLLLDVLEGACVRGSRIVRDRVIHALESQPALIFGLFYRKCVIRLLSAGLIPLICPVSA